MVMEIPVTSGIEIQSGQLDAGVALETGASYQSVGGGGKWTNGVELICPFCQV